MGKVHFSFRERALAEAERYGSDSWVFLRELLQNARDAGAGRVDFTVTQEGALERIVCRDDGCGMSAVHAHHYLFALYASSKEGDVRQAGQFGVGFWSVLRFKPDRVVIRSRQAGDDPWQVELNHGLENAVFTTCEMERGTEILLERHRRAQQGNPEPGRPRGETGDRKRRTLADRVFDAVYRYGRFLTRSGRSRDAPVTVSVNRRLANADMTLPAPSSTFRRRGFRGVVALGTEPLVELYSNGLFVRQAACLEDLLDEGPAGDLGPGNSSLDLPGSMAPQVILDSSEVEVLLARSDVRQTRHLKTLVKTAEKELERLIERQLESVRPQPWYLPLWARLEALWNRRRAWRKPRAAWWLAPASVAGVLLGWAMAGWTAKGPVRAPWNIDPGPMFWREAPEGTALGARGGGPFVGYSDLGTSYLGPRLDPLTRSTARVALSYRPAAKEFLLTALVVEDPSSWPSATNRQPVAVGRYEGTTCPPEEAGAGGDCVTIRLTTVDDDLRIPVPTGHLLDPTSVRLDGDAYPASATASGEPLIEGAEAGDLIEYRTGPARAPATYRPVALGRPPEELVGIARRLMRGSDVVGSAVDEVARRVMYDRSAAAVREHRAARQAGRSFLEAALAVGKGDCDVQNGVLVELLREAGVTARLAVGFIASEGRTAPGLHAWVEYLDSDRRWRVADVSSRFQGTGITSSPLLWVTGAAGGAGGALPPALAEPTGRDGGLTGPGSWDSFLSPGFLRTTLRRLALPGAFVAIVGLALASATRRRSMEAAGVRLAETDLAALLGGALQHPGLARLPALVHGRFVPLLAKAGTAPRRRGNAMSLHEAQRRAAGGTLFSSAAGSHLARDAARRGFPVIDTGKPEGRVASLGLGSVDLDEWSDLLDRSTGAALVRHLNAYLDSIGKDWRMALVSPLSQPVKVVDLARLGLGRRQVLIDPRSADFAACGPDLSSSSDAAAFRLLDAVAEHLDLNRPDRAHLLAELARRAVVEEHGT